MDPDAALLALRTAITEAQDAADGDSNDEEIEAWQTVGELFDALDEWLRAGGFLPKEWRDRRRS